MRAPGVPSYNPHACLVGTREELARNLLVILIKKSKAVVGMPSESEPLCQGYHCLVLASLASPSLRRKKRQNRLSSEHNDSNNCSNSSSNTTTTTTLINRITIMLAIILRIKQVALCTKTLFVGAKECRQKKKTRRQ